MNNLGRHFLIGAALFFLAAVIFAGALVWHDLHGASPTPAVTAPFADVAAAERQIPHYAAGNINGTVTAQSNGALTLSVPPLNASASTSAAAPVTATVIVDPDTEIYKIGPLKEAAVFSAQTAAYLATRASDPTAEAPDPYEHTPVKITDLTAGTMVNVLPKGGSVQGTTLHAQKISVQTPVY